MADEMLLQRIEASPDVCGGLPRIRGTRIPVAVILDGLAEGLSSDGLIDHFPHLTTDDIRAAAAYGAELARESVWKVAG